MSVLGLLVTSVFREHDKPYPVTEFQGHNTGEHQIMSFAYELGNKTAHPPCQLKETGGLAAIMVMEVNLNGLEDRHKP